MGEIRYRNFHTVSFSIFEFCENWCREIHTLLMVLNGIASYFLHLLIRRPKKKNCRIVVRFAKIGPEKAIHFLRAWGHTVKRKVIPIQAMKAYTSSGGTPPRILVLDTRCRSVINFRLDSLYSPEKTHWVVGWVDPQSHCGRFWQERSLLRMSGQELLTMQSVA